MNQPALTGFDWTALDPDTRFIVKQTTDRLHELERRTGEAIIQIGRGLIDTKQRLGHGQFGAWLESEFGWSWDSANRFMRVAETFGDIPQIAQFAPSALYALASGTVPEPIRQEFIERAEAGEPVRHKDVKARLDAERRTATVDLDSGELLDDEPEIEGEVVDPTDPLSFMPGNHTHHSTPLPTVEQIAQNNPDVERARMRRLYKTAISQTTNNLLPLKPAAVVASFNSGDADGMRRFIASLRDWCNEIESEMDQGIRMIHRKEA